MYIVTADQPNGVGTSIPEVAWWSITEVALSIIAACLPNLMFLIRKIKIPGFRRIPSSA